MKENRRIIYFILFNLWLVISSFFLSGTLLFLSYRIAHNIYVTFQYPLFNAFMKGFMNFKNATIGDISYILFFFLLAMVIYCLLTFKKVKRLIQFGSIVDEIAKGNIEKRIETDGRGSIGNVEMKFNSILNRFENLVEEERFAQATKVELITNVSHDLKTPLTSIIGYLSLIEEDKYQDEVELRYYTEIAYKNAKNLDVLINDLFELTKLQNSKIPVKFSMIDIVELLKQITIHLQIKANEANMQIVVLPCDRKILLHAEPTKLVRAFQNLIANAIQYGEAGTDVIVDIKKGNEDVSIHITNYGITIPATDIPYIFERFYRVEKSRNRYEGGSGLGLAITKEIIEKHHGKMEVKSEANETTFTVKLPLH